MLEDLDSGAQIARLSEQLLRRADAPGRWPTPIDDIVAASELEEVEESPFSLATMKRAPKRLRKAVALINSRKIRAILDRRERTVHVDPAIENQGRRSFLRLHEVGHDLLPWQRELAYAEDDGTLSPYCKRLGEQEANQTAAELLFQGDRFRSMAAEYRIGIAAVGELAEEVGSSMRATLRRYSESHRGAVCGIVLQRSPSAVDPITYRRHEVCQSRAWTKRFGSSWPRLLSRDAFPFLAAIDDPLVGHSPELSWPDLDSQAVRIMTEVSCSRYGILLLLWVPRRELLKRKRTLAALR
jgi:IrrE N-terminal-like domain